MWYMAHKAWLNKNVFNFKHVVESSDLINSSKTKDMMCLCMFWQETWLLPKLNLKHKYIYIYITLVWWFQVCPRFHRQGSQTKMYVKISSSFSFKKTAEKHKPIGQALKYILKTCNYQTVRQPLKHYMCCQHLFHSLTRKTLDL